MKIHLEHIASRVPKDKHAVIVLDKAGWHTTKKLQVFPNLTLLPLPPASPELNPCEQIWKHLRRKHLSNRCFQDDEDLLTACSEAWNDFIDDSELVTSLCSRDWAHV
ncbi:MAG: transposase [Chlamydiales bacterium]|nr:transposase [Chlamydiales bacterium]